MKRNLGRKNIFSGTDPRKSKKLYFWLLGGFTVWFIVLFFALNGIVADMLETPTVPDWVVPYNKQTAEKVQNMTQGYPIEGMQEYIARFDVETAAYLVSIAKKESNWGRRVPVSEGKDCYNYWGFRDPDNREGSGGHTCFGSPEQAVRIVGKRIQKLVHQYKRDTPKEMAVWKCGSACDLNDESVSKWIGDVGYYYQEFRENPQSTTHN